METIFLEPVCGKPGVFLAVMDGHAAGVWAYKKEAYKDHEEFEGVLSTVRFENEQVRDAKAIGAKMKLPVFLAVEVEIGGQPFGSYAIPVEISGRLFPRWAVPLRPTARRAFDSEPEVLAGFRAEIAEVVAA